MAAAILQSGKRLRELRISKFRRTKAPVHLKFDAGINVLLGKNASGKTTLLSLISTILSWDFGRFESEPFELGFTMESVGATLSVNIFSAPRWQFKGGDTPTEGSPFVAVPSYECNVLLASRRNDERATIRATQQECVVTFPNGERKTLAPISPFNKTFILLALYKASSDEFAQVAREWSWIYPFLTFRPCPRFDEALETYTAMTGTPGPTVVMQREEEQVLVSVHAAPGLELPQSLESQLVKYFRAGKKRRLPRYSIPYKYLPFLDRARSAFGYEEASASYRIIGTDTSPATTTIELAPPNFNFSEAGGVPTSVTFGEALEVGHERLSYGQKRLLAFYYHLEATRNEPVVADEVVNGLHHDWIVGCVDALTFSGRQAFLTSQNPLLLDRLTFESIASAARRFITCKKTKTKSRGVEWQWRNMSKVDAKAFYNAYNAGIQHVGEILRTRELW